VCEAASRSFGDADRVTAIGQAFHLRIREGLQTIRPQSSCDHLCHTQHRYECSRLGNSHIPFCYKRLMRLLNYTPWPAQLKWLLDSDPAIRWQVMKDLTDAAPDEIAAERSRVATQGWGSQLLSLQSPAGHWGGPKWDLVALYSLVVLMDHERRSIPPKLTIRTTLRVTQTIRTSSTTMHRSLRIFGSSFRASTPASKVRRRY